MNRRDIVLAFVAGLILASLPACESADRERAGSVRLSAAPMDRDFVASFCDYRGNRFKAWWGPHTADSCPVNVVVHKQNSSDWSSVVTPQVSDPGTVTTITDATTLLEAGASTCAYTVYLDGTFRGLVGGGSSPAPHVESRAIFIPVWPIVYANRIKVGATGTKFFVHVDGERHTVGRLKGGTGTLYVNRIDNGETTETIQPSSSEDRYVVYDPSASPPMSAVMVPAAGSPEAALFAEVRSRNTAHVAAYPPIPVQP